MRENLNFLLGSALAFLWYLPGYPQSSQAATSQPSSEPASQATTQAASTQSKGERPVATTQPTTDQKPWKLKPPKISGYFQVFYRYAVPTGADNVVDNSNFRVQRLRLGVSGKLYPWLSYDVEIDPRAPEVTGFLRDAFFAVDLPKHQELRVGQQKTQFGFENRESSTRLFAVNRAEISDAISRAVNLRDVGLGLIGHLPLGNGFRLEDAITVVNGNGLNTQDDNTATKNVWARLGLRYQNKDKDFRLWFGLSGGIGDQFEPEDPLIPDDVNSLITFKRAGADFEVDHPRFWLSTEFAFSRDTIEQLIVAPPEPEVEDIFGYYINVVGKTSYKVGPIVRLDTLGDGFIRWTFGAYYGEANARFRLFTNYEFRQVKDDVRGDDKFYIWSQVKF